MALGVAERQETDEQQEQLQKSESQESSWLAGARERLNRIALKTKKHVKAVLEGGKRVVEKTMERLNKEPEATPEQKRAAADRLFDPNVPTVDKIGSSFSSSENNRQLQKLKILGFDAESGTLFVNLKGYIKIPLLDGDTRWKSTGGKAYRLNRQQFENLMEGVTKINMAKVTRSADASPKEPLTGQALKEHTKERLRAFKEQQQKLLTDIFFLPEGQVVGTEIQTHLNGKGKVISRGADGNILVQFKGGQKSFSYQQLTGWVDRSAVKISRLPKKKPAEKTKVKLQQPQLADNADQVVERRPALNKNATLKGLFNPNIDPQRKIGIEFRSKSSGTLRRVIGFNRQTREVIVRRVGGAEGNSTEMWSTKDFQRTSRDNVFYQGAKIDFRYDQPQQIVTTPQLTPGDVLHVRTVSGSQYGFEVKNSSPFGTEVEVTTAPDAAHIGKTFTIGQAKIALGIALSFNEGARTSALAEIRVSKDRKTPPRDASGRPLGHKTQVLRSVA